MQLLDRTQYSPVEYLALEETSEFRHEYRNGQIVPRSANTVSHNQIVGNLAIHLDRNLGETASVFTIDLRLWIPQTRTHTYPDVMTIVDGLQMLDNRIDTVTNPNLIIEVLSDSTKDYDRGEKFRAYRSIPSFQEYLLVDQYSIHVEHFAKNDQGQWVLTDYDDRAEVINLMSIGCALPLEIIYRKIKFEDS
jgi:Uma2 family endonuclease